MALVDVVYIFLVPRLSRSGRVDAGVLEFVTVLFIPEAEAAALTCSLRDTMVQHGATMQARPPSSM